MPEKEPTGPALHDIDWTKPSDDAVLNFVSARYQRGKDRRMRWEQRAAERLNWAAGAQRRRVSASRTVSEGGLLALEEAVEFASDSILPLECRKPVVINQIKGLVLQKLAMTIGQPITWNARPFTSDDADVAAALVADKILQYTYFCGPKSLQVLLPEVLWMVACAGYSSLWVEWDPHAGEPDPKTKERPGAVVVSHVTGFEITEPSRCRRLRDAQWLIRSQWMSLEELRARYGEDKTKGVIPTERNADWDWQWLMEQRDDDLLTDTEAEPHDEVLLHHLWRPRCLGSPDGNYASITADRHVLHNGKNEYDHGVIPGVELRDLPEPRGRPRSMVGDVMDLQHALNRVMSGMFGHLHAIMDPRYLTDFDVPDDFLKAGGVRYCRIPAASESGVNGFKPLDQHNVPPEAWNLVALIRQHLGDVTSVHDASRGKREAGVDSGRHAIAHQQADLRGHAVSREGTEGALARVGSLVLSEWYQYAGNNRTLVVSGTGLTNEVVTFGRKDLRPEEYNGPAEFNVVVRLAAEPDGTAAVEKIKALTEGGYLNPADPDNGRADRRLVLKMLGERTLDDADPGQIHRSNAHAENERLLKGDKSVRVSIGDDTYIHLDEHMEFMVGAKFRLATKGENGQAIRDAFALHIREHHTERFLTLGRIEQAQAMATIVLERQAAEAAEALGVEPQRLMGGGASAPTGGMAPPMPAGMPVAAPPAGGMIPASMPVGAVSPGGAPMVPMGM